MIYDRPTLLYPECQTKYNGYRKQKKNKLTGPVSPRPLEALANTWDQKKISEKKRKSNKRKRRTFLLFGQKKNETKNQTYNTHTRACTHIHAHMEVKHTLAGSPLFISALTEPHIKIESAVAAFLPFIFFSLRQQTRKKRKNFVDPPSFSHSRKPGWISINEPDFFSVFFLIFPLQGVVLNPPPARPPTYLALI